MPSFFEKCLDKEEMKNYTEVVCTKMHIYFCAPQEKINYNEMR